MNDDDVWMSYRFMRGNALSFTNEMSEADAQSYAEMYRRNMRGHAGGPEEFPKAVWAKYPDAPVKGAMPDFFNASARIVSHRVADVLATVDIGATELYPVTVLQPDRETRVPGTYFCIAFRERKDTFVPEASDRIHRDGSKRQWRPPIAAKDGEMALRATARSGVDLWMEETLRDCFFVSGRLARKLDEAGLWHPFDLRRCRIVELH
ncbi:imm11 family protein [Halovulum sp. GXIMD14794]